MKILHLSDTHNCHRQLTDLPAADLLVHTGDFTTEGTEEEALDFMEWFQQLPYPHKIFIAGNHDTCMLDATIDGLEENTFYLNRSGIEIDGLHIYGLPMFVADYVEGKIEEYIRNIPSDTDLLLTHEPPYGFFDYADNRYYGSLPLLTRVSEVKPKAHLFGHIHPDNGMELAEDILFVNGAQTDTENVLVHRPRIIEI